MVELIDYVSKRYGLTVPLRIRPDTSDFKAARDVLERNTYQRVRGGFRLEAGDRWLDGGANIGAFTMQAIHHGAALVVAIEPVVDHLEVLAINVGAEVVAGSATILQGAITPPGHTDPVTVYERLDPQHQWRSSTARMTQQATTTYRTKAYPIDTLVATYGLDCVKLDIEEAEHDVLRLWEPDLGIRKLVFEWGFDVDNRIAPLVAWMDRMEAAGWETATTSPKAVRENPIWLKNWVPPATTVFAWR